MTFIDCLHKTQEISLFVLISTTYTNHYFLNLDMLLEFPFLRMRLIYQLFI